MEQEIQVPEFPNFEEKDNLEMLTKIFETSFWKFFGSFDFELEFPESLVGWISRVGWVDGEAVMIYHLTYWRQ